MSPTNRQGWLALPSLAWLTVFFAAPTFIILGLSFKPATVTGGFGEGWSLAAWHMLWDPIYLAIAWRTLWLSSATTAICITLALPVAYYLARCAPRRRRLLLIAVILPSWTNFLVRVFAWKTLLHPQGLLKQLLDATSLIAPNQPLLYNPGAVLLVLVYTYLPFAILPLYAAADRFDFGLLDAARDLGANALTAFVRVFLPNVAHGIGVAVLMVFVPALGSYVIPELVGGVHAEMIGNKIAQRAFIDRNLPLAAALGSCLMLVVLLPMWARMAWTRKGTDPKGPSNPASEPNEPAGGAR
ncbi:ABC transporter permease [Sulfidibacter corallicola]|uniref:ABC transporter permease n=1 Tax=Sulfidibacter corallicola TaxID=2818388 RepID=A0A8A4TKN5_SULCO|nr:ABC transporter permease [Sulfidibacter corallicola]QTD50506.1 ABC transporter permease [Sulfidibacter corallicola]